MKRSELIDLISGLYEVGWDLPPSSRAENLLCQLEELGVIKLPCQHPREKIYYYDQYSHESGGFEFWQCGDCGQNMEPIGFKEKK